MRTESLVHLGTTLALALLLGACAPRLYERHRVELDHHELDRFRIRYEEFDGCLLRRPVPVHYRLERPGYTLDLDVRFGTDDRPAALDLSLAEPDLDLRFAHLRAPARPLLSDGGARYRIAADAIADDGFALEVRRADRVLGNEYFRVRQEDCRALGLGARGPDAGGTP